MHKNNQVYKIFLTKMKTKASLILNPNHETRKTKTKTHVQDKNLLGFY
jgi:hypothetical protein